MFSDELLFRVTLRVVYNKQCRPTCIKPPTDSSVTLDSASNNNPTLPVSPPVRDRTSVLIYLTFDDIFSTVIVLYSRKTSQVFNRLRILIIIVIKKVSMYVCIKIKSNQIF